MALEKYNKKRNFSKTSEPEGKVQKTKQELHFVVQRHHASRLHYDFRLEMGGVLKSWAVPKGPSLNPMDKRLAVLVEDHPISYRTFEGDIPKGNYGYGAVTIFDQGAYTSVDKGATEQDLLADFEKGNVKVVLKGKILKGEFALVKMKSAEDNAWLLIKHKDKYAVDEPFDSEDLVSSQIKEYGKSYKENPTKTKSTSGSVKSAAKVTSKPNPKPDPKPDRKNILLSDEDTELEKRTTSTSTISPMLATLSETIPETGEWIYERKFDGFRAIATISGKNISLLSRNGVSLNKLFPSIVKAFKTLQRDVVLDGELVIADSKGKANFQLLQRGEPIPAKYQLQFHVFDLLALDGNDLRTYELRDRKELLNRLLAKFKMEQIIEVLPLGPTLAKAMDLAKKNKWEGVVAKELESRYNSGKRSPQWRKLKLQQSQEAIVVGYTKAQGSRSHFGALVLAVQGADNMEYIGNVGTGFTDVILDDIDKKLKQLPETKKPFVKEVIVANEKTVTWVKPKLVAAIIFSEWTADKHMRHPVFKGLREDKKPSEVKREIILKDMVNEREIKFGRITVKLTNQKKIYWPQEGITKGDMIDYYVDIASLILPFLRNKPLSLNRFPNGIEQASFFQKDMDVSSIPSWLKTVDLESETTKEHVNYLICNNEATLLWVANLGAIEINPWLSTYRKKQYPDFAVLDLDPNGVDFSELIAVALSAYEIFNLLEVPSYIKTSGSTGLHIYLHLGGRYEYSVARSFIEMVAELIHERHEETTSLERSPQKRKNKIYLDFMQNSKGQTIAAPYSVRPKPGATVSTPLFWEELDSHLAIRNFTMDTVRERVNTLDDPWVDIFKVKVDLKKALEKI